MDRKPTIPLYVGLFAVAYLLLVFILGYAITWLQIETSAWVNHFIILAATAVTTFWFTLRENRHFTKSERIELVVGSIVADITIQVCSVLIFVINLDLTGKWLGLLLIFVGHALLIVLGYSISKKIPLAANAT